VQSVVSSSKQQSASAVSNSETVKQQNKGNSKTVRSRSYQKQYQQPAAKVKTVTASAASSPAASCQKQ
jgi:uncharacterized protein YdeI (BOF family)